MQYILIPIISLAVVMAGIFGAINYLPLSVIAEPINQSIGASLTTLNSSDTMSDFPTVYNANNNLLNSLKIENTTTTLPLITTLLNLSSVGTITTGTWNATALSVAKGGTGTTSPSVWQIMLGNGSNGLTAASSTGNSGQFLTSNGAGVFPTWQTSAVDMTLNYTWPGTHNFTSTSSMASTTMYTLNVGKIFATSTIDTPRLNAVRASRNASLALGVGLTQISFDTEAYDLSNEHSSGTFTAGASGYYFVHSKVKFGNDTGGGYFPYEIVIYKNNVSYSTSSMVSTVTLTGGFELDIEDTLNLATGDTIKIYATSSAAQNTGTSGKTWLNIFKF